MTRARATKVLLALLCVFAPACAASETMGDRVNPETPLWYSRPNGALSVAFARELTAPGRKNGEEWERATPEIDPPHNRVFIGSADDGLYAIRASDGSTIWRFETLGVVQSEPLYDPEMDFVYFGSHDGALYCVRAQNGELVYRFDTGAEVARKPVLLDETLYITNAADFLFAIDRRNGHQRWQAHRTPALGMEVSGYAGPAYANGTIFTAYSDGHVAAYDARDGSESWAPIDLSADAEQAGGGAPRYLDVDTTPVPDDLSGMPVIYVASYSGGVYALDQKSGARVWSNEKAIGANDLLLWREPAHTPDPNGPDRNGPMVPERKVLVVSSAVSGMWGLDPQNGKVIWRNKVPEGGVTAPVPMMGALLLGTTRYGLFLISPRNGKAIDNINLDSGFAATPAAHGGRGYAITNAGTFVGVVVSRP